MKWRREMCWWMEPWCLSKWSSASSAPVPLQKKKKNKSWGTEVVKIWPSSTSCTNPVFAPLPLFSWFNSENSPSTAGQTRFPTKMKSKKGWKQWKSSSGRAPGLPHQFVGFVPATELKWTTLTAWLMPRFVTLDPIFGMNRSRFTADSKPVARSTADQPFFLHQNKNHF